MHAVNDKQKNLYSFLSELSHRLRTPMSGIHGMASLLLTTDLDSSQKEYVETIRLSADALMACLSDIIDLSDTQAGKRPLEPIPVDLRRVVEEVVDRTAGHAIEKRLDLSINFPPDAPSYVLADPGRISQVLEILIENAIKYTSEGFVAVIVGNVSSTTSTTCFRFSVSDSGCGIEPDKLPASFTDLRHEAAGEALSGAGLGLTLARELVDLMGGNVGIASRAGKGTTVWFELELPRYGGTPTQKIMRGELKGLRALVVDDVRPNVNLLRELLTNAGMIVDTAVAGQEALELIGAGTPYDVVLVDYLMPEMDGVEFCVLARQKLRPNTVLLLMAYRHELSERGELQREAGAQSVILKPLRQSRVHQTLTRLLSRKHRETQMRRSERLLATPPANSMQRLKVLVVEDNKTNQKAARLMLEKLGCDVDLVDNGNDGVDAAGSIPYDIILMDCQMPVMDGYDATRRIRQLEGPAKSTPIIAITANAMQGDREKCLAAGMDDYLSKPVRQEALRQMVEKWRPA